MHNGINKITVTATRRAGMGYANTNPAGAAVWRIVDTKAETTVGSPYKTKDELLGDFERFATEYFGM
jgi:hypothetical protein